MKKSASGTRLYQAAVMLFWFSQYTYVPHLSAYLKDLGASLTLIGIVTGSYGFTQMLARIPLGILYIRHITVNHLTNAGTWIAGIIYTLIAAGLILGFLTYVGLSDRNSKWVFAPEEMERFHIREKIQKKVIVLHPETDKAPVSKIDAVKARLAK